LPAPGPTRTATPAGHRSTRRCSSWLSTWPGRIHAGLPAHQGELPRLGVPISATAIRMTLRRHGLDPAPRRSSSTWSAFLRQQAAGIVACDLFTVDTLWLQRLYVLFFIELHTRHVHLAGVTANPNGRWVAQQGRNLLLVLEERGRQLRYLLRDHGAKFSRAFDYVVRDQDAEIWSRQCGHHGRTRTRSAGSERSAPSAWTGCSLLGAATSNRSFGLHRALQQAPSAPSIGT
jgi:putative transposase